MRAWISPIPVIAGAVVVLAVTLVLVLRPASSFPGGSGQFLLIPDIAHPVAPLVHVVGKARRADPGTLYFVDVKEEQASELQVLVPSLRPAHSTLVPASEIVPPGSNDRAVVQSELREMAMSQKIAAAVAERQLHLPVVIHSDGVLVDNVYGNVPAVTKVDPADVIVAANGKPTPTLSALHAAITPVKPGQSVELTIRRGAKTVKESVKTVADPADPGRAFIGIQVEQGAQITLPVKVSIDAGGIGGPSAGLAFTLEVMQQLGANVTHGHRVAATGEIDLNGGVAPIGGVKQKTYGVREAGADVFLVPAGQNARDARHYAGPNLKVIAVRSLEQALHALATLPPAK